jgi:hypothetical protein
MRFVRSPAYLPVCLSVCLFAFEPAVYLDEVFCGGYDTVGDPDSATFNPVASTFLKWLRFKILRFMQFLHCSALVDNGLGFISIVGLQRLHHRG